MKITIDLCTYNGSRFLPRQLESFLAQDRRPDEVVVCDDASTDGTGEVLRGFAARAPFPVRIEVNERNLGVVGNFEKAISLCSGDVIFLCDQDDVWLPQKLARMAELFERRPGLGFAFSDADAIDEQDRPLGYRLFSAVQLTAGLQQRINRGESVPVLLRRPYVTGAAMAFRACYRDLVLPMPAFCQHDGWIALLIAAVAECEAIAEPLFQYRQHASQQLGERKLSLLDQYRIAKRHDSAYFDRIGRVHAAARDRLAAGRYPLRDPHAIARLDRKVEHCRAKLDMRTQRWRRLPLIARELLRGNYHSSSLGWKGVAQDILC